MCSQVCIGKAEAEYAMSRKDAQDITQRLINIFPRGLRLPSFPFFSFGGSNAAGECGCKCEMRQVRLIFLYIIKAMNSYYTHIKIRKIFLKYFKYQNILS